MSREPERRLTVVRAVCTPAGIGEKPVECVGSRLLPTFGRPGIAQARAQA
ncbi:hypothetical protein [Streptomyces sp. NPDC007369]